MRRGVAVLVAGCWWACRVAVDKVEQWFGGDCGVVKVVRLESAKWRTNPALSRNPKPPPLGGGAFTRLASQYGEINRQIYRIELEEEPTTDEVLERLKKQSLKLKDQIAGMFRRVERRM